jgi:alcohol dehydrogenase class IV
MPSHITASTGFDAFAHSFEAFISKNASDYTDMYALKGIELVIKYLPIAIKEPDNREAREGMSWANTLGGLAITEGGVTLPHGMGMAIGGSAPYVTHGEALAILYPEINRWTWRHAIPQYALIGRMFNPTLKDQSDEVAAEKACDEMDNFLKKIGMWLSFKDKNVPKDALDTIAGDNFELPDYLNHPIEVDLAKTKELLEKSYSR